MNNHEARHQSPKISRRDVNRGLFLFVTGALTGLGASEVARRFVTEPEQLSLPQGFWEDAQVNNGILHVEVNAYSEDPHKGIERVDVTLQDINGDWRTVCRLEQAEKTNTYVCQLDITDFITAGNPVLVGFDITDTTGLVSRSPNGLRIIEATESE